MALLKIYTKGVSSRLAIKEYTVAPIGKKVCGDVIIFTKHDNNGRDDGRIATNMDFIIEIDEGE